MSKRAVIFDFDGTIADILPLIYKHGPTFAEKFGIKSLTKKEIDSLRNYKISEIIKKLNIPLLKLPFILLEAKKIFNEEMANIKVIPGIKSILQELEKRGYSLGILSSNSIQNLNDFLEKNQLGVFDFVHSEFNIFGKDKALRNLLKKYDLHEENVIYVGDEVRDIEACRHDKIKVIAVTWGINTKEILKKYKPTYLIDRPNEILEILR